jgi:TPR repeat protein
MKPTTDFTNDAAELLNRADAGDAEAQFDLAWHCLWENNEPPYDKNITETAVFNFRRAAEQGHCDAMLDLGALYLDGVGGIQKDFDKAIYWYQKAAEKLHPKAFRCLGYALGFHSFKDSFRDYEAAYRYFVKGALLGEENCLYELGDLYAHGWCVEADPNLAAALYKKSYDVIGGNIENDSYADVCRRLGECYLNGVGVETDCQTAKEFLDEAEDGFVYRLDRDAPLEWVDTISSELDKTRRLLRELHERSDSQ